MTVDRPGGHAGVEADAAVTATPGCRLVVRTADCVPVVLRGATAIGVAHAGWRGVAAGVVEATAYAMEQLGSPPTTAALGPHIRRGCYEFGAADLDEVTRALGPEVREATSWGTPALDLTAAVRRALGRSGIVQIDDVGACTACSDVYFSWRARQETERFATIAWIEA